MKTNRQENKKTYAEMKQVYVELLEKTPVDDFAKRKAIEDEIARLNDLIENEKVKLTKEEMMAVGLGTALALTATATVLEYKGVFLNTEPLKIFKF